MSQQKTQKTEIIAPISLALEVAQHREREVPPRLLRVQGQTLLIRERLDWRLGLRVVDHVDDVDMGGLHFLKASHSIRSS